jgi:hypothetical protein
MSSNLQRCSCLFQLKIRRHQRRRGKQDVALGICICRGEDRFLGTWCFPVTFHILVKSLISGASRHLLPGGSVVARSPVKWQKVAVFTGKPWESHGKTMGKPWESHDWGLHQFDQQKLPNE